MAKWIKAVYEMNNGVTEVTISPSASVRTKRLPCGRNRETKNVKESIRNLARLLNHNFRAGTDVCLTLTYADDALAQQNVSQSQFDTPSAVKKDMANYVRRCRRACRKHNIELYYIYVISDLSGTGTTSVRIHVHFVVNAEAAEICKQQWTAGYAELTKLYSHHHGDLGRLAQYLITQVRDVPAQKRYHPSRNLKQPEKSVTQHTHYPSLDLPSGCVLTYRSQSCNGTYTIRYYRPPPQSTG